MSSCCKVAKRSAGASVAPLPLVGGRLKSLSASAHTTSRWRRAATLASGFGTCDTSKGAAFTLLGCIELAPAEGSCERRCDGAVVVSGCEQCLCINGAETECRQLDAQSCKDGEDDSDSASSLVLASVAAAGASR